MTEQKTYALVLPAFIVNQLTTALLKRKGKNLPQEVFDKFDGDEHRTRFWLEEKEGEVKLMSHYPTREFHQVVMTPEEMMAEEQTPISFKGKLLTLFTEMGVPASDALSMAVTFLNTLWKENQAQAKKMLAMFVLMKEANIKPSHIMLTPAGHLLMSVDEEYADKMVEINQQIGMRCGGDFRNSEQPVEENEDPSVE